MRVLVTGGSGFIGSHVVDKLRDYGVTVRIFDMVYPTHRDDIEFYKGSLLNFEDVRMAMNGVDAVIHLAAVANVNQVEEEPHYAESINVRGTANVLEAARKSEIDRVVYASTSWVYSDVDSEKVDEKSPLEAPSHFYTATKITGEYYCQAYSNHFDLETTIVRFGIPYGPRARGGTVISIFVNLAMEGENLTIFGDGTQYRRFVYVEDLAEGTVLALKPEAAGEVFNLSGEEKVTINQVADTVCDVVNDVEVTHDDPRPEDFSGKDVSNEKAKRELGWEPSTTFSDGVEQYYEWYLENEAGDDERWEAVDEALK